MVIAIVEMISEDTADYLVNMDKYERELMVQEHKIDKIFSKRGL